jgi:nucleoside-diphosphate-sugar epimerase
MSTLFCFGLGYSSSALAAQLAAQGWTIRATSTSSSGIARIATFGYEGFFFDGTQPGDGIGAALATSTHVVVSAPPGATGDPALLHHADELAASKTLTQVAYLSTIGVYGDWNGAWVDESCDLRPKSERSLRRARAEQAWLEWGAGAQKSALIFRLAGIYGPGRSAINAVREGTARRIMKPGQVFNRIHVDDIAGVLLAAIACTPKHAIYNVTDDEPAPPQDVIEYAAELLGLPVPPSIAYEQATLSPMGASFYAENKRASNARAKGDLGWRLRYPTYREGLTAINSLTSA